MKTINIILLSILATTTVSLFLILKKKPATQQTYTTAEELSMQHTAQAHQAYKENKLEEAFALFHKALLYDPHNTQALYGKAQLLEKMNKPENAIEIYEQLNSLIPNNVDILTKLANAYQEHNQLTKSAKIYNKIIKTGNATPSVYYNLGFALTRLGLLKEAQPYFEKVLETHPDHAMSHYRLAEIELAHGNFEEGFKKFEWREHNKKDTRDLKTKRWNGSDVKGKTVLLRSEYGLGDTIQFIRYAQYLKEQGATVIVEAQKPLIPLLSQCEYIDKIVPIFAQTPDFDFQIPLMSCAHICKTTKKTIPLKIPYITPNKTLTESMNLKLAQDKFKIGLCWTGNLSYDKSLTPFCKRAVHPSLFKSLATLDNVIIYSLQTDEINKTLPKDMPITIFDEHFDVVNGPFMDTAAVIANLDLVITIDTSIAHLAGALGKPVWVLLPHVPDWRWMLGREDSPWYPTMKLFRQKNPGDWPSVINTVYNELNTKIKKDKGNVA